MYGDRLQVQEYIREYGVEKLKEEFSINVKEYDDFMILNYDSYKSPKFHPIVDECRSLILDKNNLSVLAKGFDRFYNDFEYPNIEEFDFTRCTVYEKLDGSYIAIWWNPYERSWVASTRKMGYAEGGLNSNPNKTFNDLVVSVFGSINEKFNSCNRDHTHLFELTSPLAKIITPYDATEMTLLTIVNRITGYDYQFSEYAADVANKLSVKTPKRYTATSFEEVKNMISKLNPSDEGFVCAFRRIDGRVWRVKTKNPKYFELVNMNNKAAVERELIRLVVNGGFEEYCHFHPEFTSTFKPYIEAKEKLYNKIENVFQKVKHIQDRKEFALEVTRNYKPYQTFMFGYKDNRSFDEIINKFTSDKLMAVFTPFLESE